MIRLQAAERILRREARKGPGLLIFDQGPVYTLARLGDATGKRPETHDPIEWEHASVHFWAAALDALIMLDAPNEILLERIHFRSKHHSLRAESRSRAPLGLNKERAVQEAAVAKLITARATLPVIRFDTAETSMDLIIAALQPILCRPAPDTSEDFDGVIDDGAGPYKPPAHNVAGNGDKG